jgi:hypothetical protein
VQPSQLLTFLFIFLDEYRRADDGTLVGLAHTVVWGNVLRGAWFYQRGRHNLWFHAIRTAVERALLLPEVEWIDLGPSTSEQLAAAKARLGFEDVADWRAHCRYDGAFDHPGALARLSQASFKR